MTEELVPVLIVAIVFGFVAFSTYMSHKTKQLRLLNERQGSHFEVENEELRTIIEKLEKRVQTLESIVTSRDFRLSEEIDSLS
ncbi:MAG: hypothetical protein O2948_01125 [Proteobacteria bacterium]|jgi:hypothetical protein|nr:hypothetical protein [Pseudomonadota bacterium]MDA0927282.1 hypothetical protein [Pseudomonadota bacterium]